MSNVILKSKFNFKTILLFVYLILLFGFLSVHMFNRFQEESKFDFWIFIIFLMFFTLFLISSHLTLSFFYYIKINQQNIIIGNFYRKKSISYTSIEKIELSKIIEYYGFYVDSTNLHLKNGEIIILYPFKYYNFYKIKIILNSVINLKEKVKIDGLEFKSISYIKKDSNYSLKKYNSSHFLSFTGVLFYTFITTFLIGISQNSNFNVSSFLYLIPLIFLIYLFSRDMNYFEVSDTHLTIKNSIQFWKTKHFQLNKIESVEILNYFRIPGNNILIKTKYFDNKTFHSDNLFNKEWDKFIEHLKREHIQVFDKRNYSNKRILY